jgi:hypothetical protein
MARVVTWVVDVSLSTLLFTVSGAAFLCLSHLAANLNTFMLSLEDKVNKLTLVCSINKFQYIPINALTN